jgi:lysophospholipase L1-like esterase
MKYFLFCFGLLFMINSIFAQHSRNEHWHERTALFKDELKILEKGGIVFLGNSITEGFDFDKYFEKTKIINRGINSDHIDGLVERLQYSVIDLQPSKLFILIGINDIGAQDSDSTILSNYSKLLEIIANKLPATEVFVHSILPTTAKWKNCPPEKIVRVNQHINELANHHKFTWIDIYSIFVNENSFLKSNLTRDGLHLNHKGYQLWANNLNDFGID